MVDKRRGSCQQVRRQVEQPRRRPRSLDISDELLPGEPVNDSSANSQRPFLVYLLLKFTMKQC